MLNKTKNTKKVTIILQKYKTKSEQLFEIEEKIENGSKNPPKFTKNCLKLSKKIVKKGKSIEKLSKLMKNCKKIFNIECKRIKNS